MPKMRLGKQMPRKTETNRLLPRRNLHKNKVINPSILLVLDVDTEGKLDLKNEKTATEETLLDKDWFLRKHKQVILDWAKANKSRLIEARKNYSWNDKEPQACLTERDEISHAIISSRSQNSGGVDLETLDLIMSWGGFGKFPLRDEQKVLDITRKVFTLVDQGKVSGAVEGLLAIKGVGISRASKIIGLFDKERFCIYDSRVGTALKTLQFAEKPILKCPAGRGRPGDPCSDSGWAKNYQHLIWTLEVIRDYLNSEGHQFGIADVEMALFVMGK
jgi:hypothetical protein